MTRGPYRTLITQNAIASRVSELGRLITRDIASDVAASMESDPGAPDGGGIVLVPILTGAMVFVADLIRHMPLKLSIVPVTVSSYPGKATLSQGVSLRGDMPTNLAGAHVLVVDDILDSGRTLGLIKRVIEAQRPASLRLAVLLRKRKMRDEEVEVDYAAFDIEDEFVIGYGLDYDGFYRNLPEVAVLVEGPAA